MKFLMLGICFFLIGQSFSYALAVERVPVAQRIENSDIVVIGKIVKTNNIEDKAFGEVSLISVEQSSIDGYEGSMVTFYHDIRVSDRNTLCCSIGGVYLLFLKKYKDGFSSAANRFGAYEIIRRVPQLLDEVQMITSQEHAEMLLFLHRLSKNIQKINHHGGNEH